MGNKTVRIIAWIAGVILLLFLLLTLAVWLFLPAEQIRTMAQQRIIGATGRECTIEGLGLSLWRGLALDLEGVELAAAEGENVPQMARLDHLYLKMKLLPLLSHRVEIVSLIISGPEVYAVRDKGGTLNLSKLVPEKEEQPQPDEAEGGEQFNLLLLRVVVEDGVLHYHDYQEDSLRVTLADIQGELNMQPGSSGDDLPLRGSVSIGELRELSSGRPEDFSAALPVSARFEGTAAGDWSWIELSKVTFTAGGVQLDGPLRLDFSKPDTLVWDTHMSGHAEDPGRLSALVLPEGFPREIVQLELELDARDGQLSLERLDISLGADKIGLSGSMPLEEPYPARLSLAATVGLEGLKEFMEGEQQWSSTGRMEAELALSAELERVEETWMVSGTLRAGRIEAARGDGLPPVELTGLTARLKGRDIESASLSLVSGGSDLKIDLSVAGWPGFLPEDSPLHGGRPRWKLTAASGKLDLPELIGPEYLSGGEDGGGTVSDSAALPLSLGEGSGSISSGSLVVLEGVELENAGCRFTVRDSVLRLEGLTAGYAGGKLSGGGTLVLSSAGAKSWDLDLRADSVDAGRMLRPFSSFANYLSGRLSSSIDLSNPKALALAPMQSLSGAVDFALEGGALEGWPALNAISSLTGIGELKNMVIDDWVGRMEVRDGRVFGENLTLRTGAGAVGADGSVGLDGSLDYKLNLALNQRLSDKYRGKLPGEIGKLLTGGSGQVELGFDLGGTTTDPSVKLDMSVVKRRAEERVKEGVSNLIDRLMPGDKQQADSSASDSATDEKKSLPGLLKGLLKKN